MALIIPRGWLHGRRGSAFDRRIPLIIPGGDFVPGELEGPYYLTYDGAGNFNGYAWIYERSKYDGAADNYIAPNQYRKKLMGLVELPSDPTTDPVLGSLFEDSDPNAEYIYTGRYKFKKEFLGQPPPGWPSGRWFCLYRGCEISRPPGFPPDYDKSKYWKMQLVSTASFFFPVQIKGREGALKIGAAADPVCGFRPPLPFWTYDL